MKHLLKALGSRCHRTILALVTLIGTTLPQPASAQDLVFADDEEGPRYYGFPFPTPAPVRPWSYPLEETPGFRVDGMVHTSTYFRPWTLTGGGVFQAMERGFESTVYHHGVGITNTSFRMNSWILTSPDYLGLTGNRMSSTSREDHTNEWVWQDGEPFGAWLTSRSVTTDNYVYLDPFTTSNLVSGSFIPRFFSRMEPGAVFNNFKGPVGTIVTTNELGGVTTDTYTTTAGLYIPGDPANTNEHFYRVQLSLEYDDHTPIPMTGVTNYLGQPPDLNSNVFLWLREGHEYTAKPMFPGAGPKFYSYSAEAFKGQQLGKLVLCTIAAGDTWPGNRPDGIEGRMNYPAGETPSDDQVIQDLLLNTTAAEVLVPLLELTYAPYLGGYSLDTSRGKLDNLTVDDRKWLTVLLLSRSTNADPAQVFTYNTLQTFLDDTRFTYRLANELAIEAAAFQGVYGHDVAGRNLLRRQTKLGQTTINFWNPVKLRFKHLIFPDWDLPLPLDFHNALYRGFSTIMVQNAAGAYHDQLIGGQKGTTYMVNTCSGHAGSMLRTVEAPILKKHAPDFYAKILFRVSDSGSDMIYPEFMYSGQPETIWPTMFEYDYSFARGRYEWQATRAQSPTPFDGFMTIE